MKWYFALSEASINRADHAWVDLIHCAVASAKDKTTLKPIMLYDGEPSSVTRDLESQGVTIIYMRVPFYNQLAAYGKDNPSYIAITSGCYLRTQIPLLEKEDQYVLYTDCDVLFRSDPDFSNLKPTYFAVAPEGDREDYVGNMNSGVMLINCETMRETYSAFEHFIANNLHIGLDQDHYKAFYQGKWERLTNEFNWKPYWGQNDNAVIIHWHGPKPIWVKRFFAMEAAHVADVWQHLINSSISSYWTYLNQQRVYSRLPELTKNKSTVRICVNSFDRISINGYIFNSLHKNSTIDIKMLVDGIFYRNIQCNQKAYGVEAFGYDGFIYNFNIPIKDIENTGAFSFTDLEGNYIPISFKGRIESSICL